MDRQAPFKRRLFDRIRPPAFTVRLAINGDHLIAPLQQGLEDDFAESLLPKAC